MAKAKTEKKEIPMRMRDGELKPNVMAMVKEAVKANKNISDEEGVKWIKDTYDGFDEIDAEKFKANARGIRAELGVITVKKRGEKKGGVSTVAPKMTVDFDATFKLLDDVSDFGKKYGMEALNEAMRLINVYSSDSLQSAIEYTEKRKAA